MAVDLQRFVDAQDPLWPAIEAELATGAKRSHWMWFVFPQLAGLGRSDRARYFALPSLEAARDYLAHPVLGPRLRHCVMLAQTHAGRAPVSIFGEIDAWKFRSCLTLFAAAAPDEPLFADALAAFYDGPDRRTLELLGG